MTFNDGDDIATDIIIIIDIACLLACQNNEYSTGKRAGPAMD